MRTPVILSWSGGKDSAMSLQALRRSGEFDVVVLLTTVTKDYDRISMHGVRRVLLEQQAASIGLPLEQIAISKNATNEEYETRLREVLESYKARGVSAVAFGDIFLEDLRRYREDNLSRVGMRGVFPIWKKDSRELARTFIQQGFRGITTCVDSKVLDKRFVGRAFDEQFLADLPPEADPCGENGEFHSFVFDGPIFRSRIKHRKGEVVLRDDRFYFCDLVPE